MGFGYYDYDYYYPPIPYYGSGYFSSSLIFAAAPAVAYVDSPDYVEETVIVDSPSYVEETVIVDENVQPAPPAVAETAPVVPETQVETHPTEADILAAAALLRQGDDAFRDGRFEEARRLYAEGLNRDDTNGFAHAAFMLPHLATGEYLAASEALRRALNLEAELIDQPLNVRAMYGNPSVFDSHFMSLRNYVSGSLQDFNSLFLLAYLYYGDGDANSALAALDDLIRRDPGDTLAHVLRDAVRRAQTAQPSVSQPAAPV